MSHSPSRPSRPAAHLVIRRITRPDTSILQQLGEFEREAFGGLGLRTYDLAMVAEVGSVLVGWVGDEIVGGCQLVRMMDEPETLFVVGFYVRPEWQGQRLSGELLGLVAGEARAMGADSLLLTVSPENKRALRLYESAGFASEGFIEDLYGEGEHRQLLRWRLGPGGLHGGV